MWRATGCLMWRLCFGLVWSSGSQLDGHLLHWPPSLTSVCQQRPPQHRSATNLCPNILQCYTSNLNHSNSTQLLIYGPINYSPWYEPQSRKANLEFVLFGLAVSSCFYSWHIHAQSSGFSRSLMAKCTRECFTVNLGHKRDDCALHGGWSHSVCICVLTGSHAY